MKWFKWLLAALIIGFFGWQLWLSKDKYSDPLSKSNNYYLRLDNALNIAKLKPSPYEYRDFIGEVEFLLRLEEHDVRIILSTKKDAYSQVAALQKVIRLAKIKGKRVGLIDLSIRHPYATFENN